MVREGETIFWMKIERKAEEGKEKKLGKRVCVFLCVCIWQTRRLKLKEEEKES